MQKGLMNLGSGLMRTGTLQVWSLWFIVLQMAMSKIMNGS